MFTHARVQPGRTGDVRRSGALRLDEAARHTHPAVQCSVPLGMGPTFSAITMDRAFWRVVGLYAEGNTFEERNVAKVFWSFHPTKEQHLVDEARVLGAARCARQSAALTDSASSDRASALDRGALA